MRIPSLQADPPETLNLGLRPTREVKNLADLSQAIRSDDHLHLIQELCNFFVRLTARIASIKNETTIVQEGEKTPASSKTVSAAGTVHVDIDSNGPRLPDSNYFVECFLYDSANPPTRLIANWIPGTQTVNGFDVDCGDAGTLYWKVMRKTQ